MNPARSFACTTVFPRVSDVNVAARSAVASSVRTVEMISTSGMIGEGLRRKEPCNPSRFWTSPYTPRQATDFKTPSRPPSQEPPVDARGCVYVYDTIQWGQDPRRESSKLLRYSTEQAPAGSECRAQ